MRFLAIALAALLFAAPQAQAQTAADCNAIADPLKQFQCLANLTGSNKIAPGSKTLALVVTGATYGGNCGAAAGNVTKQVGGFCGVSTNCIYGVDVATLGDPVFGCAKDFVVEYTCSEGIEGHADFRRAYLEPEAHGQRVVLSCR